MAWKVTRTYYFTDTDKKVMQLLAQGLSHNQIGLVLHLSGRTVSTIISALQRELCARNTAHFISLMYNNGFLSVEPEETFPKENKEKVPTVYSNPQYNEK